MSNIIETVETRVIPDSQNTTAANNLVYLMASLASFSAAKNRSIALEASAR